MYVSKINIYPCVNCRGVKANTGALEAREKAIKNQAQKELKMIKEQGKKAGTDAAWWRSEFHEAVDMLEKIAKGESPKETERINSHSSLLDFHDFGEDGFI